MFDLKNYQDICALNFIKVCDCEYCSAISTDYISKDHPEFPCYWLGDSFVLRFSLDYRSRTLKRYYYRACPQRYFHSEKLPGESPPVRISIEDLMLQISPDLLENIVFNINLFC